MDQNVVRWIQDEFQGEQKDNYYHFTNADNYQYIKRFGGLIPNDHRLINLKNERNKEGVVGLELCENELRERMSFDDVKNFMKFLSISIIYQSISFSCTDSQELRIRYGDKRVTVDHQAILNFINFTDNYGAVKIFSKVEYSPSVQREIFKRYFDKFFVDSALSDLTSFIAGLAFLIPLVKPETDVGESEWRVVLVETVRRLEVKL